MNKKIIIAIVALVAVVAVLLGIYLIGGQGGAEDPKTTTGTDAAGNVVTGASFTVTVVHADKTEKTLHYSTEEEKLGAFLEAEGLISSEGADAGMFHTVDGEKADWNVNQSYWAFYIDGEYAMTGIYDTAISDGATYKLEYTIG